MECSGLQVLLETGGRILKISSHTFQNHTVWQEWYMVSKKSLPSVVQFFWTIVKFSSCPKQKQSSAMLFRCSSRWNGQSWSRALEGSQCWEEKFGHIRQCPLWAGKALPIKEQHSLSQSIPSAQEQAPTLDFHSGSTLSSSKLLQAQPLLGFPSFILVTTVHFFLSCWEPRIASLHLLPHCLQRITTKSKELGTKKHRLSSHHLLTLFDCC